MQERKRILFVPEPVTNAHVTRLLVLANSLDQKRYDICFAANHVIKHFIEKRNQRCVILPSIKPEVFKKRLDRGGIVYKKEDLNNYVNAELNILDNVKPDVVVGDFRVSLGISCDLRNIPYVNIVNAQWSPFFSQHITLPEIPPTRFLGYRFCEFIFPLIRPIIFNAQVAAFNSLRKKYGLPRVGDMMDVYTYGTYTLYPDLPDFFPLKAASDSHRFIGPVLYQPPTGFPEWWSDLPDDKPIVYLSLGSSGSVEQYRNIMTSLADLPVVSIVSTAGRDIEFKDFGEQKRQKFFIAKYLPGISAMNIADIAVSNGGSGSIAQALNAGIPSLTLPRNMDQCLVAARLSDVGAGIMIRPHRVKPRVVGEAMERMLGENSFLDSASRFASMHVNWDPLKLFPREIDSIFRV